MAWSPTTEQILNLEGVRRRADAFRFELCDRQLNPIGEVHPDRDETVPSIQNDTSNETARRLTGLKLFASEASDVDTVGDRLRVYMVLQNGVEYRLGTFLWADENEPRRSWGDEHHSELVDFNYILAQQTTQAFGWGRGATVSLVMFFLLFRAGFELDNIKVIGEEANRGLRDPQAWEPGSTWLNKLNDIGAPVGFVPPWFDRDGRLTFDQAPDPTIGQPTIPAYGPDTRVIADSILYSSDVLKAPNDFGAFDSGTERLRTGRYQLPANAPNSFARRGFRVGQVETVQGMETQDQADKAARNLARTSDVFEYLTFSSTLDPRHDTYDIVDAYGLRWLETAWSMELRSGGLMQHSLKRVNYDVV